jgi:mono/diheme cytochrome c family protein
MRIAIASILIAAAAPALAEPPQQLIAGYAAEAARAAPGFAPSAQRGRDLYLRKFAASERMPTCAACHTDNPAAPGSHVITGKPIKPLAPAANPERVTSAGKLEKWFKRNCTEVVGRECSAAEKADFLQFITSRS